MSNFKENYKNGVGKTMLELFKKVLEKKETNQKSQSGGAIGAAGTVSGETGGESSTTETSKDNFLTSEIGTVQLHKVEQYYDGTIYEGLINGGEDFVIRFNIKDRTNRLEVS
tara:strand:- start:180 stop:515 length:336 start_codon:yes stop_codon:yes gene_type:complete